MGTLTDGAQESPGREEMETLIPSLENSGRNVNLGSQCGKQYGGSLKKLKIELPHGPVIPFLGIYPKEMKLLLWKTCLCPDSNIVTLHVIL